MKKLFLIPLMALFMGVTAWATEVSTLSELQSALDAGGEVTLMNNIDGNITISKDVVLSGGYTINGNVTVSADVTITLAGVTLSVTGNDCIVIPNANTLNVVVQDGTTNSISATSQYCDCFYGINNGQVLNIMGNGSLTINGYEALHVAKVNISAPNVVITASVAVFATDVNDYTLTAGSYGTTPAAYVDLNSSVITYANSLYTVATPAAGVVAYNPATMTTYTSVADAISAANDGETIYLYGDATALTVSKPIIVNYGSHNASALTAGAGYTRSAYGTNSYIYIDNNVTDLVNFLTAEGTDSYTVSSDINIANAGQITVKGNKTLTVAEGVTVSYKRQDAGANILVASDAKLTILGKGTFQPVNGTTIETTGTQIGNRIIDVDGELVVGVEGDNTNCPTFITTSLSRGSVITVNAGGVATLNNANMDAASTVLWIEGTLTMNGGEYVSHATTKNGYNSSWYAYAVRVDGGHLTINGGHVVGVQGGVAVYANATADINGGTFETVYGNNYKKGTANTQDNHYALYVARLAVVNVYGGSFKVQTPNAGGNKVVLSSNDDAYNTYGVINIYGGNFARKAEVSPAKNTESSYPASVPTTSQWYSSFGTEAPLPAGYEYYETGDATYPYGVRVIAGTQTAEINSTETTIPWQQTTTWSDSEVPEDNTIVTIPANKTVVVSNTEATTEAVAQQIFINQSASLTVEEGTSLTIGEGGINIGNGGQLVVEPNAIVKIGAAGVITTNEEALIIESTEDKQGVLVYDPATTEETQPKATVRLYTKSKQTSAAPYEYLWQRFAVPIMVMSAPENDYVAQELFGGASTFNTYVYGWNGNAWYQPSAWSELVPNKGYQIANNTVNGGITYSFTGNLVGNQDVAYTFENTGFEFFGNSYTAPIYVPNLLADFAGQTGFEATINVYDIDNDKFEAMTTATYEDAAEFGYTVIDEIASMQAFIIRGTSGNSADLDYTSAIWNNPRLNPSTPAPVRRMSSKRDLAKLAVVANGVEDCITLRQSSEYSEEFDNGADASKYMNENTFNFYANTELGNLAQVSTNDMNNTVLGFQSADATQYTLTCQGQKGEVFVVRDLVTNEEIEMTKGVTYTFVQQPNTNNEARFIVMAGRNTVPTAVETVENDQNSTGVYTVMGQYVGTVDQMNTLPAGVYVVNGVKIVK